LKSSTSFDSLKHDGMTGGNPRVVVTGANGFIGKAVCKELSRSGFRPIGVVRSLRKSNAAQGFSCVEIGNINERTDWGPVLRGAVAVVHLAARVHVMSDESPNSLAEYRRVNVGLTINLARCAAALGVRRFVFISSIKVNGEETEEGRPFKAEDEPRPQGSYGVSKHEAEQALIKLAEETGLEVVIIRPPLVYGPGVKANFNSMMRWLARGFPLPFGAVAYKRSLVSCENLTDFILTCIRHPAAANQIFLVSDGEDMSVVELLYRTAESMGLRATMIPIPTIILRLACCIAGKEHYARRLLRPLQVDITKNLLLLGWTPPLNVSEALRRTASDFLDNFSELRGRAGKK
jgi:nucleoside-diphosphate-sugar epimerase